MLRNLFTRVSLRTNSTEIMKYFVSTLCLAAMVACFACQQGSQSSAAESSSGLKVAYVNGDSIVKYYDEFQVAVSKIDQKQLEAENKLKVKMQDFEAAVGVYQRKAQQGALSPKEMQEQEQRLGGMQQAIRAESDLVSEELMGEMSEINARLQKIVKDKLNEIKKAESYDFIFNLSDGGPILVANDQHDITDRVLRELNKAGMPVDSIQ
jgi:outer membrane protein